MLQRHMKHTSVVETYEGNMLYRHVKHTSVVETYEKQMLLRHMEHTSYVQSLDIHETHSSCPILFHVWCHRFRRS